MTATYDFMTDFLRAMTAKGDLLARRAVGFARVPAGTNGQFLTADPAQDAGLAWQSFSPGVPGYTPGRWYTGVNSSFGTTSSGSSGTTVFVTPMYIAQRTVFTDIGIYVASVSGATALRFAVYSGVPIVGQTVQKVAGTDAQVTSITGAALNSAAFAAPVTLERGWYGISFFPNGDLVANSLSSSTLAGILGSTNLNNLQPRIGAASQTYGVLSSIALAVLSENTANFAVGLKAQ